VEIEGLVGRRANGERGLAEHHHESAPHGSHMDRDPASVEDESPTVEGRSAGTGRLHGSPVTGKRKATIPERAGIVALPRRSTRGSEIAVSRATILAPSTRGRSPRAGGTWSTRISPSISPESNPPSHGCARGGTSSWDCSSSPWSR